MNNPLSNPNNHETELTNKIVAGLERISEAFKVLLWEKAKRLGLSPIQIQILIFIAYHKIEFCNVTHLAKEFNLTKPTISDVVRVLINKSLIEKTFPNSDSRSYTIQLTNKGKQMVSETENFALPIKTQLKNTDESDLKNLFKTVSTLIYQLNKNGVLTVQRTCYACKFHHKNQDSHYCNLLEKELISTGIRIDCPEFEEKL